MPADGMNDAAQTKNYHLQASSMAKASSNGNSQRSFSLLTGTVLAVAIIGFLFWAQAIFIPLALAIFIAFLLGPLVSFVERRRIGRVPAVLLVVAAGTLVVGSVGWMVTHEFASLVRDLPNYKGNIQQKIRGIRDAAQNSPFKSLARIFEDTTAADEQLKQKSANEQTSSQAAGPNAAGEQQLPRVAVEPTTSPWLAKIPSFISSLVETLGASVLTLVLVVFILLEREDLRNRVIRLVGRGQIALTTKALDEAAHRLSHFLLVQAISNTAYGVALSIGLFVIGVPYAFLWGFLTALLRYVPYVGTWIAATMPLALSIAISEGWLSPLLVLGLFCLIELFYANLIEPKIFGQSMGVSAVALLMAAAFWAFLWGPIGLVLSNPLTVFLVVMGKYFPQLELFTVLMADEPALAPHVSLYQRLLARDRDEALKLVQAQARQKSIDDVYDSLLVPVLTMANRDFERDELTESDYQYILGTVRKIIDDIHAEITGDRDPTADPGESSTNGFPKVKVLCCPARDAADEVALEMFRRLLDPARWDVDIASTEMLSAEMIAQAQRDQPALVCISALPPGGLSQARYLCKRLRSKLPETQILVGRWGLTTNLEQNEEQLREAGADDVDETLLATRRFLRAHFPTMSRNTAKAQAEPAA